MPFQSTLPVGGATEAELEALKEAEISIHAPRGGSDRLIPILSPNLLISIHAPRGGSDPEGKSTASEYKAFQSTLPVGGATIKAGFQDFVDRNFNPRSPWGERHMVQNAGTRPFAFQSTLPVGGATASLGVCLPAFSDFNPRSPWGERLIRRKNLFHGIPDFNPRSPWGERRQC